MSKKTQKILMIILIFQFFCFLFLVFPSNKAMANDSMPKLTMPDLQIKIPGLTLTSSSTIKCEAKDEKGNFICKLPWIGEYVAAIYKYVIGIVGILATVVLMVGGIIWLTAGGNATRVGEAKAWIGASITGLVIALCSYMILYQINPELINLKPIKVTVVQKVKETAPPGTLTESEARNQLKSQTNWINVLPECPPGKTKGCVVLSGVKQATLTEIDNLRKALHDKYTWGLNDRANGSVVITGGTDCVAGVHKSGNYDHCNGYKIDLELNEKKEDADILFKFIDDPKNGFKKLEATRSDGATLYYKVGSKTLYAKEKTHWDVLVCGDDQLCFNTQIARYFPK